MAASFMFGYFLPDLEEGKAHSFKETTAFISLIELELENNLDVNTRTPSKEFHKELWNFYL